MNDMREASATAFWHASKALYDKPEVMRLALKAQDSAGRDVNVILLLAWLHQRGLSPDADGWKQLKAESDKERRTFEMMRAYRRSMQGKGGYEEAKSIELDAERSVQERLIDAMGTPVKGDPVPLLAAYLKGFREADALMKALGLPPRTNA